MRIGDKVKLKPLSELRKIPGTGWTETSIKAYTSTYTITDIDDERVYAVGIYGHFMRSHVMLAEEPIIL